MEQSWNPTWDSVFASREWGKYPDLEVVRFVARNFYAREPRSAVKLLEVGCGTGANIWYLAREGFDVSGADGSAQALSILQQRLKAENLMCSTHCGDITQLPYADQTFDGIIDCECIYCNTKEHSGRILDEIRRVLKPEGLFLSMTFSSNTWGNGCGTPHENDANSFRDISEGPLQGTGLARFTSEKDINELYESRFALCGLETICRSCDNRQKQIDEWVITCRRRA